MRQIVARGQEYPSLKAFALASGLGEAFVRFHVGKGLDGDAVLDLAEQRRQENGDSPVVVDGKEFASLRHVADHYGRRLAELKGHLSLGWTLEQAVGLNRPPPRAERYAFSLPKGLTLKALAFALGVHSSTVRKWQNAEGEMPAEGFELMQLWQDLYEDVGAEAWWEEVELRTGRKREQALPPTLARQSPGDTISSKIVELLTDSPHGLSLTGLMLALHRSNPGTVYNEASVKTILSRMHRSGQVEHRPGHGPGGIFGTWTLPPHQQRKVA